MVVGFDDATRAAAMQLVRMGLEEDLREWGDLTSLSTIPKHLSASVDLVAREAGIVCGVEVIPLVFEQLSESVEMCVFHNDGSTVERGTKIATFSGKIRTLLTAERTILNFMIHLSGVASKTAAFVRQVQGAKAVILDTRKTLPGYRLLHKFAVRCGGGRNHRMGLYDGILIKDNHLAARGDQQVATAVTDARRYLAEREMNLPIEIEVDTLDQLSDALAVAPEIVLLDNMSLQQLSQAIEMRDALSPLTLLEASGGVNLDTVAAIAETGVDRISVGALTHSAVALDLGFDWPWRSV